MTPGKALRLFGVLAAAALLASCSHRGSASIEPASGQDIAAIEQGDRPATDPADIFMTTEDIKDRPYKVIGDIEAYVSKTTIFNSDPTHEQVDQELREEAAEAGADAVILIRYGTVGMSFMSYGTLEGRGRAVRFVD